MSNKQKKKTEEVKAEVPAAAVAATETSTEAPATEQAKIPEGQVLNQAQYDVLPPNETTQRYLILSSQRTGSNYLSRRLCNVKDRFGVPSEYLNPVNIKALVPRIGGIRKADRKFGLGLYMKSLQRVRTTADGVFGVKVQPKQLANVVGKQKDGILNFVNNFDRIVILTRRDKLGQAISGAIAQVTGKWMNDQSEPELDESKITAMFPLIARNLNMYFREEQMLLSIAKTVAKPVLRIEYEEIEKDGDAAFASLVDFLSAGEASNIVEDSSFAVVPEKPVGLLAQKIRAQFIAFMSGEAK